MPKATEQTPKPWYREPWPWFIALLLGSTVVAGLVTVWIAVSNPDFLVVEEEEYQQIRSELRAQSDEEEAGKSDPGDG